MADLSLTPVATQIRPPATMSIADMLNIAQGAQALQQAQAMNPLQLEAQRLAVQQAAAVNPELLRQQQVATRVAEETEKPRIAQQAAQTKTAQTQEQAAQFALQGAKREAALKTAGAYAVDPRIISGNPKDTLAALAEMQESMEKSGLSRQEALYQVTPWVAMMHTNPGSLATSLKNAVRQGVGSAGQLPLQTGALTTVGGQPALFTSGTGTISPAQLPPTGGPGMAAPQAAMPGAATPAAQTAGGYMLQYPVRQAGMPYAPGPSEAADLDAGMKYRTGLMNIQPQLIPARRNVEEVIRKAGEIGQTNFFTSGVMGDLERKLRGAIGSTEYKELSKDLANVQISMIQASGGSLSTDAGKHLAAIANGDETYPPNVLISIARRTQADLTNQDLQAQAAQKFASRFGDNNMKAFQTEWARNADSKIFEVMNLAQNVTDPKQRKEAVDKLLGTDPARRKEFFDKYQRIQRMVQTGALE